MKIEVLMLFVIIMLSINVQATGFSPSSLIYNLNVSEEDCKMITISSDSETISVSDKWAENKDVEWKVSLFNETAEYHNISIDYDDELSLDEREVEVCLSGNKIGEYHGVILMREEQEGNSIIQMGVWLKVNISEPPQVNTDSDNEGTSGGGGSGGSSEIIPTQTNPKTNNINTNNQNAEKEQNIQKENSEEKTAEITGAVINESSNIGNKNKIVGIVLIFIGIIGLLIYYKNYRRKI